MKTAWILAGVLTALSAAAYAPLFSPLDRPYRESIAGGYQGITRFVAAHPDPWGWNPLPYGGLPTQFVYLPGLPYAGAALSWITGAEPAHAYRIVSATLAVLGPVALFFLVRFLTRSPGWAFCVGLAYVCFSPLYGLINAIDTDRGLFYLPWRLQVLMKYGEGPHNAALTLLPLAWLALWRAATSRTVASLIIGAIALAAVTVMNWIGALALAISCALLLFAVLGKAREHQFSFARAFATAALAYGFVCFWLTPSFIRTTALNWPKDAFEYKVDDRTVPLFLGWIAGMIVIRVLFAGRRELWLCWTTLLVWAFGFVVVVYYGWKEDVLPESRRYALEFELALFMALGAWLWRGLRSANNVHRFCAILPLVLFALQGRDQLRDTVTRGWSDWQLRDPAESTEARISRWLAGQKPQGRVFVSGGLRFRLNRYADVPQMGGTFESGLHNRVPVGFIFQIRTGIGSTPDTEARDAIRQLTAFGVEYIVVHGFDSDEFYRDYRNPAKFEGKLERVTSFGADHIYRVPFRSLAAAVQRDELPPYGDWRFIEKYAQAFADPQRPLVTVHQRAPGELEITGIPANQTIALNVNWHEGWRALTPGVQIEPTHLGSMFIHASAHSTVRLSFTGTTEQKLFGALSAVTWLGAMAAYAAAARRSRSGTSA